MDDLKRIKAIVFDLEGTLLDSHKSRDKFIEEQYERFHDYFVHVQLADYRRFYIQLEEEGLSQLALYKKMIKHFHIDRLTGKDLYHDYDMHYYRYIFPYYNTQYTLETLQKRGYLIGVIANGKSKLQHYRIYAMGIAEVVNYISTSEHVGYPKPHPKIYEDILTQLDVTPEETLYVGDDALNDIAPAHAMGMTSVWFKSNLDDIEPLEEEMDYEILDLETLLTILPIKQGGV